MTHVRRSRYYPQSNGKIERYHRTNKADTIRPGQQDTVKKTWALVTRSVAPYTIVRLHSAVDYITPHDFLEGRSEAVQEARKLERSREPRARK